MLEGGFDELHVVPEEGESEGGSARKSMMKASIAIADP